MRKFGFPILVGATALALTLLGVQSGWWWLTPLAGLLIGLLMRLARLALLAAFVVGALGWGVPLAILALGAPVGAIAAAVASVIGLPPSGGAIIIVLTFVFGGILCVVGAWVGIASRGLAAIRRGRQPLRGRGNLAPSDGTTHKS
jgi:hypothetical protein